MSKPTAIVSHPACALHDTGWNHPEHQGRLPAVVKAIYRETPDLLDRALQVEAPAATEDDILRVHSRRHLDNVREAVALAEEAGQPRSLSADTMVSGASWEAALGAAGAAIHATRLVLDDEARTAFALTRPPGHHATAGHAMGFCLFNNVAVAARWAQAERDVQRVMILDWDVHHGNGTQDIFYGDGAVYYLSLHLTAHYPGTGHVDENGTGDGVGANRNVPFHHGVDRGYYRKIFDNVVAESIAEFRPELILVSAGFDVLAGDPLGGMTLEPADLHAMTRLVMDLAPDESRGRVVVLLEGGYVPQRIGDGAVQVVRALAGLPATADAGTADAAGTTDAAEAD